VSCPNYCTLALQNCTGPNELYEDRMECGTTCRQDIPEGGTVDDTEGDTLGCRIHALALAEEEPATHCANGAVDSVTCQ
jgi:hypothetical protein